MDIEMVEKLAGLMVARTGLSLVENWGNSKVVGLAQTMVGWMVELMDS